MSTAPSSLAWLLQLGADVTSLSPRPRLPGMLAISLVAGCFYIPGPREDVNSPPQILSPQEANPILYMISSLNPARVVARDPDGDRMSAYWSVPGYTDPLITSRVDDGADTTFLLMLPRLEYLHDQKVTVIIVDDDPDDWKSTQVDFTVKLQ